jgi:hypothetical protein
LTQNISDIEEIKEFILNDLEKCWLKFFKDFKVYWVFED